MSFHPDRWPIGNGCVGGGRKSSSAGFLQVIRGCVIQWQSEGETQRESGVFGPLIYGGLLGQPEAQVYCDDKLIMSILLAFLLVQV